MSGTYTRFATERCPFASLNPRRAVGDVVAEPLRIHGRHGRGGAARVRQRFELVGLEVNLTGRHPHELSGGQRPPIGIARALAGRRRPAAWSLFSEWI